MIEVLDIIWDKDFIEMNQSLCKKDFSRFINPVIKIIENHETIDNFIETKCIPKIKEQLKNLPDNEYVCLLDTDLIKEIFPLSYEQLPFEIYTKLYLKEKYDLNGFLGLSGNLESFERKGNIQSFLIED